MEAELKAWEKIMGVSRILGAARLAIYRLRGQRIFRAIREHYANVFPNQSVISRVSPDVGVEIVRINDCPELGLSTFATCGLSRYAFPHPSRSGRIGIEFSLTTKSDCLIAIEKVMEGVVRMALYSGELVLPGTAIEYNFGQEFEDQAISIKGLYCWPNVWHSSEVNEIEVDARTWALILELIPITDEDLALIRQSQGEFIERTASGRIDLLDFARKSATQANR